MVACIHTHLCMQLIPSPADYAARSCPDVWKWLGRPKGLPVSGIWAPPYYFNHFRSSRLVTRSVIHRGSYNWYQSHPALQGLSQMVVVSLANIFGSYVYQGKTKRESRTASTFLLNHPPTLFLVRKCNVFNPLLKIQTRIHVFWVFRSIIGCVFVRVCECVIPCLSVASKLLSQSAFWLSTVGTFHTDRLLQTDAIYLICCIPPRSVLLFVIRRYLVWGVRFRSY